MRGNRSPATQNTHRDVSHTHGAARTGLATLPVGALFLRSRKEVSVVQELDGARRLPNLQLCHQARTCPVEQRQMAPPAGDNDVASVGRVVQRVRSQRQCQVEHLPSRTGVSRRRQGLLAEAIRALHAFCLQHASFGRKQPLLDLALRGLSRQRLLGRQGAQSNLLAHTPLQR